MALLAQRLAFHDPHECDCQRPSPRRCISDVEAFIRTAIRGSRVRLTPDELEELLGEGLAIMVQLREDYEPGRGGRDPAESRWAGYAAKYLRIKLSDAHHRLQENARLVSGKDGVRRWHYEQKAVSLTELAPGSLSLPQQPSFTPSQPRGAEQRRAMIQVQELNGELTRRWAPPSKELLAW